MSQIVMVVDDSEANLQMAMSILKDSFEVMCAKSGVEALHILEANRPDLILMDYNMPQMDGFEVIEQIKAKGNCGNIPVIMLITDEDRDAEVRGFQIGVKDFIKKPFIKEIVLQRVGHILEISRLQKNLQDVMQTFASIIDTKDTYSEGHSLRVAEYSKEIAMRMGKSKEEQDKIYRMGLLHDIGKIGVPDEIINKETRLTEDEYRTIKHHPAIGSEILMTIEQMPDIMIGARWHHERYDGGGYPDGLVGTEIPEAARIIGVADAYDAMTSKRSYRSIMAQSAVRDEIERGKRTQFDPEIADVMLDMIDEDTTYTMREKFLGEV